MLTRGDSGRSVRARRAPAAGKGATLSRLAAMWCQSEPFQKWVESRMGAAPSGVSREQHAAQYVRDMCGVTSRAELDHNARAETLFHATIRRPFRLWSGLDG